MLFAIGFIALFTIGGVTGVVLASSGLDVARGKAFLFVAYFLALILGVVRYLSQSESL
jgi:heme/copper-type cytochrome/quinol oxidase subunit 1